MTTRHWADPPRTNINRKSIDKGADLLQKLVDDYRTGKISALAFVAVPHDLDEKLVETHVFANEPTDPASATSTS